MPKIFKKWSRREFLKTTGAVGVGSVLAPLCGSIQTAHPADKTEKVPRRPFGKTGIDVPILALGGMFDTQSGQLMLRQAVQWGVTYWDTAALYGYGRSEAGMGRYFQKFPQDRPKIFLVTKSDHLDIQGLTRSLEGSLKRLQTSYVDLYLAHGISSIQALHPGTRQWVEKVRTQGKIRLFGFSTHENMANCLRDGARLGWIDGIMTIYNYRLTNEPDMMAAIKDCVAAGIGLTAMKTQGDGAAISDPAVRQRLFGPLLARGFTEHQAKLKVVWEHPDMASICSQMPSLPILKANVIAARDPVKLTSLDRAALTEYDRETFPGYCAGCADICENLVGRPAPISRIMRYLMYSRSYGDHQRARDLYQTLPASVRRRTVLLDYDKAEEQCPRKMAIGRLMREASILFA
ncbi:MAG: aldo/keto reductase [Desulfobacterales bacterium]|nr:aldo/keto reductase [Desulfobacterales bacterium]